MTSPDAKVEKEEASAADSTVPPKAKSGGGGRSPPPSSSSSSSGTSRFGTTATSSTAPLGYKTTDTGDTAPDEVSGQDTATQDTQRFEAGRTKSAGSSNENEKRRSSPSSLAASRTTTTSTSQSPARRTNDEDVADTTTTNAAAAADTMQQPQEQDHDNDGGGDERIRHEMDSNQHGESRLLPYKFKRRKVAAVASNDEVHDASTSTGTSTLAAASTTINAETSSLSSMATTSKTEGILASAQAANDSAISTARVSTTTTAAAAIPTSLSAEIGILLAQAEQAAEANTKEAEAVHSSSSSAAASGVVAAAANAVSGRGPAQAHAQAQGQRGDIRARLLQLQPQQHDVASSSSTTAVPAAPATVVPSNSTADQYQQLQALVAQKREQLAAALLTHQQWSAASASAAAQANSLSLGSLGDLSGSGAAAAAAAASIDLGLGALGTTGTRTSQASINAAAANLAAARAQAQADAALSISSHPSVGSFSADAALRSYLMGSTTSLAGAGGRAGGLLGTPPGQIKNPSYYDLLSSPQNRTLPSQFGSPAHNPLSTGLDLTARATNAMLQHQADLEYLQQLRTQRSLLSSISASTVTSILARLQSGTPGSGAGTISTSSSSVGFPSAASVASPSPVAAAQSQGRGQGLGHSQGIAQIQGGTQGSSISRGDEPRISKAPPLPNITPAAAKAPADQRITRSDGIVCLSSGIPHFTNRTIRPLSSPDDVHWLSTYLCFVRERCVEVFEADAAEINCRSNSKLINDRQIGIRCRYCAHIHQRDRAGRSTSFPSSLSRIYQSLTMMLREHFPTCTEMPPAVKERFLVLKGQKTAGPDQDQRQKKRSSDISAKESRSYWVDSAKDIGLYDTELGIKRRTPPAQAVQDSSLPGQGA